MISVILAARDEERLIGRAIRSVLAQTLCEFELLVIDNGSTDRTIEIVSGFAKQDARVRLLHESAPGAHEARNRGVREAAGDLVAIQDADDVSHPERFARLAAHVARHPDTVAVGSWALCYSESEGWREPFHHATSDRAIRSQLRMGPAPFIHSATLFRRDAFLRVGGYPAEFPHSEDYALWGLLAPHGRLANLPMHLAIYRHQERAPDSRFRTEERDATIALKRRFFGSASRLDEWLLRATIRRRRRAALERVSIDWPSDVVRRLGLEELFSTGDPGASR